MKTVILTLCLMLLLCGCSENAPQESSSTDYVTDVLGYVDTEKSTFALAGEEKTLSVGDAIGKFTLAELKTRTTDDRFLNVRADFTCEITLSGTIRYQKSTTYPNTLQFYPDEPSLLPKVKGDSEPLLWVIIREEGDPMKVLGLENGTPAEKKVTLTMTSFTTNYTQHNTINYITIKAAE